jgi:hypothetical protein
MNMEQEVKSVIETKLEDGTIAKVIEEEFEKSIRNSVTRLFSSYGDVTKVLKGKIEAVMVERIENQDFSKYLVKMDSLLSEFVEQAMGENLKLAENFKSLLLEESIEKIYLSDLFNKWMQHVAKDVETDGLEVEFDDAPYYESVEVTMSFEKQEDRAWSSFEYAIVYFECEHDESMNMALRLWCYNGKWTIRHQWPSAEMKSLRNLDEFVVFLMRLTQDGTEIELDVTDDRDEVCPEKEPEASFS